MVRVVRVVRLVGGEGDSRVRVEQLHHLALVEDVAAEEHPLAAHLARRVRHHLIEEEEELLEARRSHRELQPLLLVLELAVEAEHQLEDADVRERAHLCVWGEMGRAVR